MLKKILFSSMVCSAIMLNLNSDQGDQLEYCKLKVKHLIDREPKLWSENVPGVKTKLKTDKKVVALTLDLCGLGTDSLDHRIIDFLVKHKIPATFFVSYQWTQKYPEYFAQLKTYPFFDFQNHGLKHRPCSINGQSKYGNAGTKNIDELLEEVELSSQKLAILIGKKPMFYRSGTAYYDDVAVEILNELGHTVVGFDILGDAGTTFSPSQVIEAFSKVSPGSIIITHANRPERASGSGVPVAIQKVIDLGYEFVRLVDYELI